MSGSASDEIVDSPAWGCVGCVVAESSHEALLPGIPTLRAAILGGSQRVHLDREAAGRTAWSGSEARDVVIHVSSKRGRRPSGVTRDDGGLCESNIRSLGSRDVEPHELENPRRSLAMLNPGATASLSREEAMRLITEVADLQARLDRLRLGLR